MIRFSCPACRRSLMAKDEHAGRTFTCPCGHRSPIPRPASDELQLAPAMPAGRPCPACGHSMPPTAVVCIFCGYNTRTGARAAAIEPPVSTTPVSDHAGPDGTAPESFPEEAVPWISFITAAWSPLVITSLFFTLLRGLAAYMVLVAGIFLVIIAAYLSIYLGILVNLALYVLALGLIFKTPLSLCQATCRGWAIPRTEDWPAIRSGLLILGMSLPPLVPLLPLFILAVIAKSPALFVLVFLGQMFLGMLYMPMSFLSVAESGGAAAGLNPIRVFKLLFRLFLPYLLVVLLVTAELVLIFAVLFAAFMVLGLAAAAGISPQKLVVGVLALLFIFIVLSVHPFLYQSAMLGLLYRKYAHKFRDLET